MKKLFYALTHNVTRAKAILIMFVVAVIVWGGAIWYSEANPERYLMGDFTRWEVWVIIVGGLFGMGTGLWLRLWDKARTKRLKEEQLRKQINQN